MKTNNYIFNQNRWNLTTSQETENKTDKGCHKLIQMLKHGSVKSIILSDDELIERDESKHGKSMKVKKSQHKVNHLKLDNNNS